MALTRGIGAFDDGTALVPGVGTNPLDVRKMLAGLFASTGVMPGAPSPLLTGTAGWAYSVAGPAWFVTSRGASDGSQFYSNDGAAVIGTTGVGSTVPVAPGAGLQRIDIAWTRHPTNTENGDTSSAPIFGVASGLAASVALPPTIPAGAIELGRNLMTSAATSTTSAGNTISQTAAPARLRGSLPHAEFTTSAVGLTSGTLYTSLGAITADVANSTDTTFATVSGSTIILATAGVYAVMVTVSLGAAVISGRTLLVLSGGPSAIQSNGAIGESGLLLTYPNLRATSAGAALSFQFMQTTGGVATATARIAVTRISV